MEVKAFDLASYNENSSAWVIDGGNYQFLIGASSRDIKATLDVVVTGGVEKTNNILHLQSPIYILKKEPILMNTCFSTNKNVDIA